MQLRVSDNRRFLVRNDGLPFFYLGDTAWELFHRLSREDTLRYLETRAAQRFTIVHAVVLAEHEFVRPNAYGALPLHGDDPTRPNEAYFEHVDWVVRTAADMGLWVGMLPTWGDKWNQKWGAGPEIFTPGTARSYGAWLGARYREQPIVWILGGDRPVETATHRAIIDGFAAGIGAASPDQLITFHPSGQHSSSEYFHAADWLDFNMYQTGHSRDRDSYTSIAADYALTPIKPCLDAEPGYEEHPNGFQPERGYLNAYDVRRSAYYGLFAGAFGHTYGCHPVWQFAGDGWAPVTAPRMGWRQAIELPGAGQMQWARALIESRPFLSRIPDQSILRSDPGDGTNRLQATRDADGSYALIYSAAGRPVAVDLDRLTGATLAVTWYDPRTGAAYPTGTVERAGVVEFAPPAEHGGPDWVLMLDDTARAYPLPG